MNGNANLNANNLTPQNVIDWRLKLGVTDTDNFALKDLTNINPTLQSQMVVIQNFGAGVKYTGAHVCIESWRSSDNNAWYRLYSDGWKECGIKFANNGLVRIEYQLTLPISFSNSSYQIQRTSASTGSGQATHRSTGFSGQTTTGFKASFSDYHYNCYFYCCGY